ncbi:signal peptidase I [Granulicella cerasi]|uniref:Signal peptidase I n=1 Tax=Granulicella cerasi TaxID=741063 RepID=A0ABW1Z7M3_9BACT|nr:signal peptidase I [Granulicella cerasi]
MSQPPQPRRHARPGVALVVRSLLELLVIAIFVVTFVLQPIRIPTRSMVPTLHVGDMVLGNKQAFAQEGVWAWVFPRRTVQRGDVAVFRFPPDPKVDLIKRVVGLPGDRIRLRDGRVLVNGKPLAERYAYYAPAPFNSFRDDFPTLRELDPNVDPQWWQQMRTSIHGAEITVPQDSYFMLGDNRNESEDSRYWGFVPSGELVAQPVLVYLSPDSGDSSSVGQRLRELRRGFHTLN